MEKTIQVYVLPSLIRCYTTITSFDLWMNKGAHDVFTLVANFLGPNWQPKHIIARLFEATNISRNVLTQNLIDFLDKFGDGGYNTNAMTFVLKYVINCETLGLQESFNDTCFGHVYSKAYEYAIIDEKMYKNLRYVFIKVVQAYLQKCITWPIKYR